MPFFTAWRWFVKFDDGRDSVDKLYDKMEREKKELDDVWVAKQDDSMDLKEQKRNEQGRRKAKVNKFAKKQRDPLKLINGAFELGGGDEESVVDMGEQPMAHELFAFDKYDDMERKLNADEDKQRSRIISENGDKLSKQTI